MKPLAIWRAQGSVKEMSKVSIRQLLGVMLRNGTICKDDKGGYFLRASMSAEEIKNFDRNQLLKDHIKTSELHALKRGALPADRLWAAKELVAYEEARHKAAKRPMILDNDTHSEDS
jgi:hypothetical protein